jgi:two-component system, NtrC family, response regulator PilR
MGFVRGEKRLRGELPRVLVVDDEADIRELVDLTLSRMGLAADCAATVAEAKACLEANTFRLCLTDMRLPDGDGLEIVRYIGERFPSLPVAVITAHGSADNAVAALKAGAFDYIAKPVGLDALRTLVKSAMPVEATSQQGVESGLVGESPLIVQARATIEKLARSQAPVHVAGESGTGKEVAAREIHRLSSRRVAAFIPVNCGAIPENLVESEFFGYRKGAFTGAGEDRDGFFQAANGGTLFLDEVADLPLAMQVKILRAIQERKVRKVGSAVEEPVDVRIISATHRNLKALVETGEFRTDLYYRLNVIELKMPSLRERREDIPLLVQSIAERHGILLSLASDAERALFSYGFPGNVRELENILERAAALSVDGVVQAHDLQLDDDVAAPQGQATGEEGLQEMLDRVERQAIVAALEQTRGNRTAAARLLGVSFRSLRYRIERLSIEVD